MAAEPRRRMRLAMAAVGMVAALMASAALTGPANAAPAPRALAVDPTSNLADGQEVQLTFSHMPANSAVYFMQCVASPRLYATDCTIANQQVTGISDATGSGLAFVPVYEGQDLGLIDFGTSDSSVTNKVLLPCDASHPCVIGATPNLNSLTGAVFATLGFAPSPAACPPPGPNSILGSGSSAAYRAMYAWSSAVCLPPAGDSVGYTAALESSPDGLDNLNKGLTQFGDSGPLPQGTKQAGPVTYENAPVTATGVVLAYRMYQLNTLTPITTLKLSPDDIARIFLGGVSFRTDPAIAAENPTDNFPSVVYPLARADHSSETFVFTSWLTAASTTWTYGATAIFPSRGCTICLVTGGDALGAAVVGNADVLNGVGTIGYVDASVAAFYHLPTVQIVEGANHIPPDNQFNTDPEKALIDSIQAATAKATLNADGTVTPDYRSTDAWPMLLPTWVLAPMNVSATFTAQQGAALSTFLQYAAQGGQANLPLGDVPIPSTWAIQAYGVAVDVPSSAPSPAPDVSPSLAPPLPAIATSGLTDASAASGSAQKGSSNQGRRGCSLKGTGKSSCAAALVNKNLQRVLALLALADSSIARYVLPVLFGVGVVSLIAGGAMQTVARRRRRST